VDRGIYIGAGTVSLRVIGKKCQLIVGEDDFWFSFPKFTEFLTILQQFLASGARYYARGETPEDVLYFKITDNNTLLFSVGNKSGYLSPEEVNLLFKIVNCTTYLLFGNNSIGESSAQLQ